MLHVQLSIAFQRAAYDRRADVKIILELVTIGAVKSLPRIVLPPGEHDEVKIHTFYARQQELL